MSRLKYLLALVPLLLVFATGCPSNQADLGESFTLAIGESTGISGEDMTIKLVEVTSDSRCPEGAQCIVAGEARIKLTITYEGQDSTVTLVQPGGTTNPATDTFEGYILTFNLKPYPQVDEEISDDEYMLAMTVSK
jgi:hypothetical protein